MSKVTGLRSKVTQKSDNDVAQLDPLRNIPAKFDLPAANGCGDITRTRSMDRRTDRQNGDDNTPPAELADGYKKEKG